MEMNRVSVSGVSRDTFAGTAGASAHLFLCLGFVVVDSLGVSRGSLGTSGPGKGGRICFYHNFPKVLELSGSSLSLG